MKKVMIVFGTRPELIKTVCLIKEFQNSKNFETIVCSTGQHREMIKDLLELFEINLNYDLNVMEHNQSLSTLSSKIFSGIEKVLKEEKIDLVFVQGDTTTAFITSLVCFYNSVNVAHVEAGLRTETKKYPYPEEMNRRLISEIADFHFAPTDTALNNILKCEGLKIKTGNTGIDTIEYIKRKLQLEIKYENKVLITVHRRESFGEPLINICKAIQIIANINKDTKFIIPVHPNPNVKEVVYRMLNDYDNISLCEPIRYDNLIKLISEVKYIITDSGGIQEEAASLKKNVLVLRNETERMEGVYLGIAKLIGTDTDNIVNEVNNFVLKEVIYNPYGDGKACERILKFIEENL